MKKLIEYVKARLRDRVPSLKYIDEYWGQLDFQESPVKWPCALIDILNVPWQNQGKHIQDGILQLSIKFADVKLSNTNIRAPQSQRDSAAHIFDVMAQAFKYLHGWTDDSKYYGPLTRINTRKIPNQDGIRIFEVIYAVHVYDDMAEITDTIYPMTPEKIEVQTEIID